MPARKKRRSFQHIMEDQSLQLVRKSLPEEWAIHDYKPDYGIDIVVEIFEYTKDDPSVAETLGELFFVQVKSIQNTKIDKIKVFSRGNVEKGQSTQEEKNFLEIEVIKFNIETNELITVQSMGSGIPVLLFLVSLDLQKIFFVCLNDLIDKVISPEDLSWTNKNNKTISIPVKNEVLNDPLKLVPLYFYAKRAKLYSAFVKFNYQHNELQEYLRELIEKIEGINIRNMFFWQTYRETISLDPNVELVVNLLLHFISLLKKLDIWTGIEMWTPLLDCYKELIKIENDLRNPATDKFEIIKYSELIWYRLRTLTSNYEELCREWFLPTYLSQYLSYPEYPDD
jgi:hypothetical protein